MGWVRRPRTRAQAELLASFLTDVPLGLITSSPLKRAALTADTIAALHPSTRRLASDARFEEMCFGDYEGRRLSEFRTEYREMTAQWSKGHVDAAWPGSDRWPA